MHKYPALNDLVLHAYQKNYDDLLHTAKQIICYDLEDRLIQYLDDKVEIYILNLWLYHTKRSLVTWGHPGR